MNVLKDIFFRKWVYLACGCAHSWNYQFILLLDEFDGIWWNESKLSIHFYNEIDCVYNTIESK